MGNDGKRTARCVAYDPATGAWAACADLPRPMACHVALAVTLA
eukprot:NODE_12862_length_222_cov_7.664740_g11092_i0.p4 GENE.NODE_12862_length_222_cov_7.664740_g11092_i0~~NODE_12862_length_222_cov_7.664740_g11092_i0.p4  ORF type:complete len:50 (+),score=23.63 NODE_12862_length_222_cov_7.664740_g11092_i0:23-151(+)